MMLKLDNISKTFRTVKAVDGLSMEVGDGEIVALLGPNGAGKTTSVRMIVQIIQPDSGRIHYSPDITETSGEVRRDRLGYLPEERGLYQEIPVIRNLLYLAGLRGVEPDVARKDALEWLERLELTERADEKVSALSKGNQQKVQFIASVLHKPRLAVLDEPFSGFDPINQERISSAITDLRNGGMTILLSAHQMQLVERIADRILLIGDGRELLSGTLSEIRKKMIAAQKLSVEYDGEPMTVAIRSIPGIQDVESGINGGLSVYMTEDADLNRVLKGLADAGRIRNLQTADISLHEIYLHSFRKS
ncbi:MAG: ATP-binding cassette domain-containing protein [Balneolaceae bacterium]|nr:MAG: ATP-binding cassette domain-containing protein [Balneolaceae bacterium]